MARNLSPQGKRARREGIAVTPKQAKVLSRRSFPPGQHGPAKGMPRLSEYGKQLREKQKAKFIYGLMERQFRNFFKKSAKKQGDTGYNLYKMLEKRLDNVVFRAGLAKTRAMARQLVSHAHIRVNGRKVNIPSYQVKVGDEISVRDKSKEAKIYLEAREAFTNRETSSWITTDIDNLTAKIVDEPSEKETAAEFNPKPIIEFYSR